MNPEEFLRGTWTFKAHGRSIVLKKQSLERSSHVLMKAFLWALYLPDYPNLTVETWTGDRFKPDVVELDVEGNPLFWGESGKVGLRKLASLVRRYPSTHFAVAKWGGHLRPHVNVIERALKGRTRKNPLDLLVFPEDGAERLIDEDGAIDVQFEDLTWKRFEG